MPAAPFKLLSVVVPAYNEAAVLEAFHARLSAVLASLDLRSEIVFVNDGSTDSTFATMLKLRERDGRVGLVNLSRNFGKEIALTAGLDQATGDAVVVIDADLQDPPELIHEFVKAWRAGHDVVYARRTNRAGESVLKRASAFMFYRLIDRVSRVKIPLDTGDFRLMSRRALDALRSMRERNRFMKGMFAWVGFPSLEIPYERDARYAGTTKFNYWRLWNFALDGVTSFTTAPLRLATYLGLTVAAMAFLYGVVIIYQTIVHGNPVAGYPSLLVIMLFLGGVQLLSLGIIGEYLGRMFDETKQRPLYVVQDRLMPRFAVSAPAAERAKPDAAPRPVSGWT